MTDREWMPEGVTPPATNTAPGSAPAPGPSASWQEPAPMPVPTAPPTAPPAGWYADREVVGTERFWDGSTWTEHRRPASSAHGGLPSAAPQRKRLSRGAIIGIVVGAVAVLAAVAVIVAAVVLPLIADSTAEDALDAPTPDGWSELAIMGGAGTVSVDAGWEDIYDLIGVDLIEGSAVEQHDVEVSIDGAWMLEGDLYDGGVALVIASVAEAGGPSSARIEAGAFVRSATEGIDDVVVTSERTFTTASGHRGYLMEYTFPFYDMQVEQAVGAIVVGSRQLLAYTDGTDVFGSGVETLEIVLDSLVVD